MKLYLIQHAESKSKEEDPARPLSDLGRKIMQRVSEYAAKLGLNIREIIHSDKLRAKETAEILANSLGLNNRTREYQGLAPNDNIGPIRDFLTKQAEDLAIVGHLPFLTKITSLLLSGSEEKTIVNFKMGGIVCLNKDEGNNWVLEWIIIPEIIKLF